MYKRVPNLACIFKMRSDVRDIELPWGGGRYLHLDKTAYRGFQPAFLVGCKSKMRSPRYEDISGTNKYVPVKSL